MQNPFDVKISNKSDDEEIVKIWRRHPITLIAPLFRIFAFIIIPILLLIFTQLAMFTSPWLFVLYVLIVAICVTYAAYEWVSWYGDVYVLTTERIIDVEQNGFFHRTFDEASVNKIQDISYEIKGFLQTVFDYGTVTVFTAGPEPNIDLNEVTKPQIVAIYLFEKTQELATEDSEGLSAEDLIKLLTKHKDELDELHHQLKDKKASEKKQRLDELKKANKKRRSKKAQSGS